MPHPFADILDYHRATAHVRDRLSGGTMDWSDRPAPFKQYRGLPTLRLTHDLPSPDTELDRALNERDPEGTFSAALAAVCSLTAGITREQRHGDGSLFHFRAQASAGALYPTELYVSLQNVTGMNDGLYHYSPLEHALTQLREGPVFVEQVDAGPTVRFHLTALHHRSVWKYGPRAYRYCLLDTGHVLDNLLLSCGLHGFGGVVDYDFNDDRINRYLGVDPERESCLAEVHALGCSSSTPLDESAPCTGDDLPRFSRCARRDAPDPKLLAAHELTASFARCPVARPASSETGGTRLPFPRLPGPAVDVMRRRRSRRNFVSRDAGPRHLTDILAALCVDRPPMGAEGLDVRFLAGEHTGLTPGLHQLNRDAAATTLVAQGRFNGPMAHICLDQSWLQNAALHIAFAADLPALVRRCGPRAYRYAHLEAGRLGQRVYLAAEAKKFGACGIGAYFDREAANLLQLNHGADMLYLLAAGPVRK